MKTFIVLSATIDLCSSAAIAEKPFPGGQGETQCGVRPFETEQSKERFQQLDEDRNGLLSREEAATESDLANRWSEFDKNHDGKLSPSEFSMFEQGAAPASGQEYRSRGGEYAY